MNADKPVAWVNAATQQFGFDPVENLPRRTRGKAVTCMNISQGTRIVADHLGPDDGKTFGIETVVLMTGGSIEMVRLWIKEGVIIPLEGNRKRGKRLRFAYRQVWAATVLATFARAGIQLKILARMAAELEAARQERAEQRELMPAAALN